MGGRAGGPLCPFRTAADGSDGRAWLPRAPLPKRLARRPLAEMVFAESTAGRCEPLLAAAVRPTRAQPSRCRGSRARHRLPRARPSSGRALIRRGTGCPREHLSQADPCALRAGCLQTERPRGIRVVAAGGDAFERDRSLPLVSYRAVYCTPIVSGPTCLSSNTNRKVFVPPVCTCAGWGRSPTTPRRPTGNRARP